MNIHHLELFYYVARHGGVSAAARHIPYGIQQPAISAQVIQLEDDLGTPLFHRRPFQLTKAGEELFRFIEPFFGGLEDMGSRLRGGTEVRLRIGAPETVQREYLPGLLQTLRTRQPKLTFSLYSGRLGQIESKLLGQEIDAGADTAENLAGLRDDVRVLGDVITDLLLTAAPPAEAEQPPQQRPYQAPGGKKHFSKKRGKPHKHKR